MNFPEPAPSGRPLVPGVPPAHHSRGERILHVDDEPTVTLAVQRVLQKLGYEVETFNNSVAALDRLRTAPGEFDLVLTDLMMPIVDGLEIAEAARILRPELPVVLLSAYTGAHSIAAMHASGVREIIAKPANVATIAASLRRALESASTA
ncbi:MAG TPA: response regulator [Opitutaceae bacterium]|nr:response regulator [Opitutaceae bacterium]